MRLILLTISTLVVSISPLLAIDIGSPLEPVMATTLENGQIRVKYFHAAQVQHPVLDAQGNEKQIIIISPQGDKKEPETKAVEVIESWSSSDGFPESYIFYDTQGNVMPLQKVLLKFKKEAPAMFMNASYEEIKQFLPLLKPETILFKHKVPPTIAPK